MLDIFSWKFPVGRLFGITIRVHIVFLLVLIPLVLRFSITKEVLPGTWVDTLTIAAIFVISTLLHEMGHCFGARSVGGEADDIMLWPLGGLAEVNYLPNHPWAHFVTAICGPLVNAVLCVVSGLALALCFNQPISPVFNFFDWYPFRIFIDNGSAFYRVPVWGGGMHDTSSFAVMLVTWIFWANWFQFVFNMVLVGIPYDGGNIGRSILWPYVGYHRATTYMITSGFVIACLMFMAVFFWDRVPMLAFLALFTFFMCWREWMKLERGGEDSLFGYDFSAGYTSLEKDIPTKSSPRKKQNFIQRWLQRRNARKMQREQEQQVAEELRMDELLEKIQQHGKDSLSDEETRFLKRVSDRYRNRN